MAFILAILGYGLLALAIAGAAYALCAAYALGHFFKPAHFLASADAPPVTIFKPLNGAEPGLLDNLAGFCRQEYAEPMQMVLGVQSPDDPAIAIVDELKRLYPTADIALVVETRRSTVNPKIANLINMLPFAKYGILVMSDADISVAPDYLQKVVAALERDNTGAVTCCYRGAGSATIWSKLAAMGMDYQFLPSVVFGVATGLASPCFGQTIAIRRQVLDEIGGFAAFGAVLAEDFAIGRAIRAKGYRITIADTLLINHCAEENFSGLFRHELRWAFTIKSIDPAGYAGSIITHMAVLALIGAACLGFSGSALAALAAVLAARLFLAGAVRKTLPGHAAPLWLLPFRDILSFAVFIAAFFVRRVEWRGVSYAVTAKGELAIPLAVE